MYPAKVYRKFVDKIGCCIVQQKLDVVLHSESRGEAASEPYRFAPSPIVTQFVQSTEVGSRTLQHLLALLAFPRLHAQHKPRNL